MNPTPATPSLARYHLRATEAFVEGLLDRVPDYRPTAAAFRRELEAGHWYAVPAVRDTYYVLQNIEGRRLVFVVALRDGALTLQNVTVPGPEWDRRFAAVTPCPLEAVAAMAAA